MCRAMYVYLSCIYMRVHSLRTWGSSYLLQSDPGSSSAVHWGGVNTEQASGTVQNILYAALFLRCYIFADWA